MTSIAFFSTDWSFERVPDQLKSARTGRPEFIEGQHAATFGGTYYTRLAMPGMELGKHGYETFLSYQIDTAPSGVIRAMDTQGVWHEPDCVVMQRQMGIHTPDAIKRAKSTGQVIINDLDDSFKVLPKSNVAIDSTDPIKNPNFNRVHYYKSLAVSSAVTVSTPALYREMELLGVPVFLCRNMIDIERWPQLDPGTDGQIGWIGGIQWRANDMFVLKQFLPEFLEDFGLPFYHGGDSQVPGVPKAYEQVGIDPKRIRCTVSPLTHISEYPKLFEQLNISLIPLEDVKFNHAKSALKALESSASGLPYIVSDLPEQRWFTQDGGMGRLAKNWKPKTWEDHLMDLLDPDVRRIEGAANRLHAEKFDIRENWQQWADVYAGLGLKPSA